MLTRLICLTLLQVELLAMSEHLKNCAAPTISPFVQGVKIVHGEGIASTQGVSALINLRVNVAKFCCLLRAEANSHYARHCVQRYGGSCLLVQHCFGLDHKTLRIGWGRIANTITNLN